MQKLFDIDSAQDVAAGATASLNHMCRTGPNLPLSFRCAADTLEAFAIERVAIGCQSLLLMSRVYAPAELKHPKNIMPELLHVGSDFSIEAHNRSEDPARFRCEVWGLRKVPAASWEPVALDLISRGLGVLACIRCRRCGEVLRIRAGGTIPNWCIECLGQRIDFETAADDEQGDG